MSSHVHHAAPPPLAHQADGLAVLAHGYAVDGRVSWHDPSVRGFAPMNCYLVTQDRDSLLIDSGLTIHEEAILGQLDALLDADQRLSIFCLRLGEFDAMCNIVPILKRRAVHCVYGLLGAGHEWADFRGESIADFEQRSGVRVHRPLGVPTARGITVTLGEDGARALPAVFAPLHLLPSYWIYDPVTKTLFTNDAFTQVVAAQADGPWLVEDPDDPRLSVDVQREHLVSTRFWWLEGADVRAIRSDVADVFARHDVATIAPAYGCLIHGPEAVGRAADAMDQALVQLGRSFP